MTEVMLAIASVEQDLDERPLSRASSAASSRLTREEVTVLTNDEDIEEFCRQVFTLCDTNGDGYITQDELLAYCDSDDVELTRSIMQSMDTNKDGRISYDEFRTGLYSVSHQITSLMSTPSTASHHSNFLMDESTYESEPSKCEKEEAWLVAMERIDPHGYISKNKELKEVWIELLDQDSILMEHFEGFLGDVVCELDKSHADVEQIHLRMRKLLSDHTREVYEMDGMLNEQLTEAYVKQEQKSQETSHKLSSRYQELLADRDALIDNLTKKEETLLQVIEEKSHAEQELKREKEHLISLNKSLQDQLTDSYSQLTQSQKEINRLSRSYGWEPSMDRIDSSITASSVTDSLPLSSRGSSMSPPPGPIPTLSPPTQSPLCPLRHPPASFSFSQSLAAEVQQATGEVLDGLATPTTTPTTTPNGSITATPLGTTPTNDIIVTPTQYDDTPTHSDTPTHYDDTSTHSDTPTPTDTSRLLGDTKVTFADTVTVATSNDTRPMFVPVKVEPGDLTSAPIAMETSPLSVSNILTKRGNSTTVPTRVFKVVVLGDSGVGKTSLVTRLSTGTFVTPHSTLGIDYTATLLNVGEEKVVFQLWDTAGQERFHSTTAVYFRRADAFIIVYDVTNANTFKNIRSWVSLVKATLRGELPLLMLMGNKTDQEHERKISTEQGHKLSTELNALFSEASALSGDNVVTSHSTLASLLLERENQDIESIRRSALHLDKIADKKCRC